MKENKYDNENFFAKYSEMTRSKKGLQGAGEWSELQKILPNFCGKSVLDLGCGYGWHCKYARDNGAAYVLGIDISQKMLEIAECKNNDQRIDYQCIAMEDLDLPAETFDVVLSSLAFHYIKDFETLIKKYPSGSNKVVNWCFLSNIRSLLLMELKIGIMMKRGRYFISQ